MHTHRGAGVRPWAGTEDGSREPDAVLACAGDAWIREHGTDLPEVADWTWSG
ncbi:MULTISPECIES: hypothetical protein [unclassified Streptomyces]|uniref:hypothetical protein n=1 Tax=unclassified Streptomyces TaxID=2593676 RepID=UPI0038196909